MDELTAISRARGLLEKHAVARAPVDIAGIAVAEGFEITESDKLAPGASGMLLQRDGRKVIVVNKNDHPFRRRFTIAHEMAHLILGLPSVHGTNWSTNELERFGKRPREEILCDVFAAECLVPWRAIKLQSDQLPFTVETISHLSSEFEASKPCVASRFAQVSGELLAYVPIESGVVRNAILSKPLRECGFRLVVGAKIPKTSAVFVARQSELATSVVDIEATDWSHSDAASDFSCHEEAFHAGDWDQSFALLTLEPVATRPGNDVNTADGSDDDDTLAPLTGHLSWGRR